MHETVFIDPSSNNFSDTQKAKIEENKQTKKTQKAEMVIQTMTRRVMPTTIGDVEKHLPNGDIYIGSFVGNSPHGFGKYLWKDGCMHEGEWKRGKANGKGKFSWPSGATYIGDFKGGRMEGIGMFIGIDGDVYKGGWMCDRKHGYGEKRYANGDVYEGTWKRDSQDGVGKYIWKNGNVYSGEWKRGVICGKGVLLWANGDRFEGCWENGVPKLKWDGWNDDERDFPVKKRSSVDGSRRSLNEKSFFPRICIWESDGEAGDITCDIVDNVEVAMLYGDGFRQFRKRPFGLSDEVKRPGKMISKGHKNYELMINLQMGIRYSIEKHASISRDLKPSDFNPNEKFWTRFPPGGSNVTPPHQSAEFRWKDYCPLVFRKLRELFQVDPAQYMLAICGNETLRELSSPGKSGSSFYLTQDDRFLIKTVKKSEVKVLIRMLHSYYQHICRYQNSLLTKFCGVHCVKPVGGPKIRFIVMENLFCSEYRIHRRFDLKGSSHGRITDKPEEEIDETATLKDLDLNFSFRLDTHRFHELIKQIDHDCLFLEAQRIMDYSLLVGMHFRDHSTGDKFGLSPYISRTDAYKNERFTRGRRFVEADIQNLDRILSAQKPPIRLGANMSARAERMARRSDFDQYTKGGFGHFGYSRGSEVYEVVLYFGIIDILQDYDITKRLEHAYKSLQADPTSISAVDPKLYSKRFRDFIGRIFIEDR